MSGYRDRFAAAIWEMLDREPDFIPSPEQLDRYQRMRLPDDLLTALGHRAGLVPCQRCAGAGAIRRRNVDRTTTDVRCPDCKGAGRLSDLLASQLERIGV